MKGLLMKTILSTTASLVAAILLTTSGCTPQEQIARKETLETQKDKVSYAIGMSIGRDFKTQGVDIDLATLDQGISDVLGDKELLMTEDEVRETLMAFQEEMMKKQSEAAEKAAEKNAQEGEAFLSENGKKEGIVTLPSGLQYRIITEGTGKSPAETDSVTVHYRGTLIDGTEFDSSYKRDEPVTFPVGGVIAGWTEALQLMKEGAKWELFIPSSLAYGERGAPPVIGPNATLLFEVELISVN